MRDVDRLGEVVREAAPSVIFHLAAQSLMGNNVTTAFIVAAVHTLSMTLAGGLIAVIIYLWLGLRFLSKTWFNLDIVWAISLVLVGTFGLYAALAGH